MPGQPAQNVFIQPIDSSHPDWIEQEYGTDPGWNRNKPIVPVYNNPDILNYEMQNFAGYYHGGKKPEWGLILPFSSRAQIITTEQGRSRWNVIIQMDTGERFPITVDDLMWLIHHDTLYAGRTMAPWNWFARKQGANYLLKLQEAQK